MITFGVFGDRGTREEFCGRRGLCLKGAASFFLDGMRQAASLVAPWSGGGSRAAAPIQAASGHALAALVLELRAAEKDAQSDNVMFKNRTIEEVCLLLRIRACLSCERVYVVCAGFMSERRMHAHTQVSNACAQV